MAVRIQLRTAYIFIGILIFIGFLYFVNAVTYNNGIIGINLNFNTYKLFGLNPATYLVEFGIDIFIIVLVIVVISEMVRRD